MAATADTPTPAFGHPFPREGELGFGRCCPQWPRKNSNILLLMSVDLFLSFLSKLAKVEFFILKEPCIGFG